MKAAFAMIFATGIALSACAPYPAYVYPVYVYPAPVPLVANRAQLEECTVIRREIVRQQRIAQTSGIMATPLVEASVRLNVSNVITGLEQRAALAGCPV